MLLFFGNFVLYINSLKLSFSLKQIEENIEILEKEVEMLEEEALAKESLEKISTTAERLGFAKSKKILRIDVSKVALKE